MVKKRNPRKKTLVVYLFTLLFSLAYILIGRHFAMDGYPNWEEPSTITYKGRVEQVISQEKISGGDELCLSVKVLNGPEKGSLVTVRQSIYENYYPVQDKAAVGDKILFYTDKNREDSEWLMLEYVRSDGILILGFAFALAVLVFGRWKGLNTLISLAFTCLAVFMVFIPAVLSGQNIYLWSIVTCLYTISMTMLFINGISKKSFAAGAGCFAGVAMAGVLTLFMDQVLGLTGMTTEDALYLQMIEVAEPINLRAIVFAAIIIGAMGAIMDVAMDIASSLEEIRKNTPEVSARSLIRSGMNIGRDVMGTMANTLVLAYIGSSLSTTLLMVAYNVEMVQLFNMEMIIVELLQAIVGSTGILLTIPLTSLICSLIYPGKSGHAVEPPLRSADTEIELPSNPHF
ncbi:MAG: YibE/F family protein [Bacillota bacterium]|nr:YibE/F family protein [Bacillota bacterium]